MKRTKAITFRLSESEYEKVQNLADERHMNPTEYARLVTLGNRIKPTIISKTVIDDNDKKTNESVLEENKILKQELEKANKIMDTIAPEVENNGYVNWHKYKHDPNVVNAFLNLYKRKVSKN